MIATEFDVKKIAATPEAGTRGGRALRHRAQAHSRSVGEKPYCWWTAEE
jgi:hypothetical protein